MATHLDDDDNEGDMKVLLEAALILRKDIKNFPEWQFKGTFDDFELPEKLNVFCRWTVTGNKRNLCERRTSQAVSAASILAEHIISTYKTDRQISYEPKSNRTAFKQFRSTPLSVVIPLTIHKATRHKNLVNKISHLNIGDSYSEILKLEKRIASAVCKRMVETGGFVVPPFIKKGKSIFFAIDNIDWQINDPNGQNQFHGTVVTINQQSHPNEPPMMQPIKIQAKEEEYSYGIEEYTVPKVNLLGEKFDHCPQDLYGDEVKDAKLKDLLWIICYIHSMQKSRCISEENSSAETEEKVNNNDRLEDKFATWNAFNSLATCTRQQTDTEVLSPLIRTSPTDQNSLFTTLKLAMNISAVVCGEERRTVITLDLDLYEHAVNIRNATGTMNHLVLRMGELHVVFAALHALGKYIDGCGLDQIWTEQGIYGPATVRQLFRGKHYKRLI